MHFEVLIKCDYGEETAYSHYYIVEAKNQVEAITKAKDFISDYFVDEDRGDLLADHDNIAYRFSDGEIVELIEINETTPEKFLKTRTGRLFLIGQGGKNEGNYRSGPEYEEGVL